MERSSPTKPSAFHYASLFGHFFWLGCVFRELCLRRRFWTKHENSILNLLPGCKSAQKSFAFLGSLLRPAAISRMSSVKCSDYWLGLGVQSEALARENHISYEFKHVGQLPLTFSEPWRMTEVLLLRVSRALRI